MQVGIGAGSLKTGQARHQPLAGKFGRQRQYHAAAFGAADAGGGLGDGGETAAYGFGQQPPVGSQHHGAGTALEQRFAQLRFQRADAVADGGGAERQLGSGGFKAAQPCGDLKGVQCAKREGNTVHKHRYSESK